MVETIYPGTVSGTVRSPGSKSHTIRALLIAALADGRSVLHAPLYSRDSAAAVEACRRFGATVKTEENRIEVEGIAGTPRVRSALVNVENSGTTLYLATTIAALGEGSICFDGDESIRRRSAAPLIESLRELGARIDERGERGCAPFCVSGPLTGGKTSISCRTSQYLSSLLIGLPLAAGESEIDVPLLFERPYVEMTLSRLDRQEIRYERRGLDWFRIPGGQQYHSFEAEIPGDFSSATFFFVLPAVTGGTLTVTGLDLDDPQGDKEIVTILEAMGCSVERTAKAITVTGPRPRRDGGEGLRGGTFDLNAMPDALPALAVAATTAAEPVRLVNVAHAREKETDRIAVMTEELSKMGAAVRELPDGLQIDPSTLSGAAVDAHEDHRVAMSLAIAGVAAVGEKPTRITGAESAEVTFPGFYELLSKVVGRSS